MKKLLLISSIALGLLGGCASNENISTQSNMATMQSKPQIAHSKSASAPKPKNDIQNEIAQCIQVVNEGKTAQSIDGTIFALDPSNLSSKL